MNLFDHLTNGYSREQNVSLKFAIMGAPGSGKSTLSAGLLYFSKLFFFKADAVPEVAKWMIYKNKDFSQPNFELNKFKEQKKLENIYPKSLEITICEAPLIISAAYAYYYHGEDSDVYKNLLSLANKEKHRYTHFFITRKLAPFENFGRRETESQSEELHSVMIKILEILNVNYMVINRFDEHIPLQVLESVGAIKKRK